MESSNEDEDYFERKHNPIMPQIIFIRKLYHDQKGRPSPIRIAGRLPTSGQIIPISNGDGGIFSKGDNGPPGVDLHEVVVAIL
jgi:hypothetical protein